MNMTRTWDKVVELSDEQYRRLREARTDQDAVAKMLGHAIYEASCKWSEEDRKFWTCVRDMAGAQQGQQIEINWVTHQIGVYTPAPWGEFAARRWAPGEEQPEPEEPKPETEKEQ